jgi:hypothetical protein
MPGVNAWGSPAACAHCAAAVTSVASSTNYYVMLAPGYSMKWTDAK